MQIGDKIRNLRKKRNLSRRKLAELVGVSESYITKLENYVKDNPSDKIINKLGEVLRISPDYFRIKETMLPDDYFKGLPQDVLNYLHDRDFYPFLKLAIEAYETGVPEDEYEIALRVFIDIVRKKQSS